MESKQLNELDKPQSNQSQILDNTGAKMINESSKKTVFLVNNQNNRFKTELARNNWKTILDVAMKRKNFDNFDSERLSFSNNFSSMNSQQYSPVLLKPEN
ncbi:hypothetical protein BpHYR1_025121 [Brachionus plicatilis]|uniref:Uncharacterized protein n=1 Tax=Brachionus plicatilis TaxID=10195 RepID=A0A3M7RSH0_BRAPC|nr:hypothetical protein BpHYR1_025121 [Brachionus plicatilis]